jgi:hypothetical protein
MRRARFPSLPSAHALLNLPRGLLSGLESGTHQILVRCHRHSPFTVRTATARHCLKWSHPSLSPSSSSAAGPSLSNEQPLEHRRTDHLYRLHATPPLDEPRCPAMLPDALPLTTSSSHRPPFRTSSLGAITTPSCSVVPPVPHRSGEAPPPTCCPTCYPLHPVAYSSGTATPNLSASRRRPLWLCQARASARRLGRIRGHGPVGVAHHSLVACWAKATAVGQFRASTC